MRIVLAALLIALGPVTAEAREDPISTGLFSSTALSGYDAVAYFEAGTPTEGSRDHTVEWRGATWRFASEANRARFEADPEAFAPAYGGYCAWAVAQGYTAKSDPTAWKIVEERLYLNYSHAVQRQWEEDIPGNIRKADGNWPGVLD